MKNWQSWIPIFGILREYYLEENYLSDSRFLKRFYGSALYQSFSIVFVMFLIFKLLTLMMVYI